ncbi:hypothetical protein C8Q73DRAFT_677845 [Cubamyces lactineus]|nr:hypothetical protein C8Q73DRAFT_677845 [Cubamyces lactineus]
MKREAEPELYSTSKRARPDPDPRLVSEAFKPNLKRKAADICRKGTDGTGYIEGKVYERGSFAGGCWQFLITVELGSRVQVLLSGSCSKYYDKLPIAVGAQVRIGARGLVLDNIDGPSRPLLLPKKFVWNEGATLYVKNPKTNEECLVDTWADQPSTALSNSLEAPIPEPAPSAQGPPAPVTSSDRHPSNSGRSPTISVDDNNAGDTTRSSVNHVTVGSSKSTSTEDRYEHAQISPQTDPSTSREASNPRNPPSPPSGLLHDRSRDLHTVPSISATDTHDLSVQRSLNPTNEDLSVPHVSRDELLSETPPIHNDMAPMGVVPQHKTRPLKGERKATSKQRREQNRRQKSGVVAKLPDQLTMEDVASRPDTDGPRAAKGEDDGEEYYWEDLDTLPTGSIAVDNHVAGAQQGADAAAQADVPAVGHQGLSPVASSCSGSVFKAPVAEASRPHSEDPWESLRSGCVTNTVAYMPLCRVQGNGVCNLMGVVESPGAIVVTRTHEFSLKLVLYDPTNYETSGLRVTLFDKSERGLPKVDAGDILMLRSIQVDSFSGGWAVGPSYKGWQWAVYRVKTGMLSSAPADTCALRHFQTEEEELKFSLRLGDWWREVSSNAVSFDVPSRRRTRPHKTIAEAENEEYFDCTVEILHGLRNENGVYTVFVTDYTRNPNVSPTQGEWCPVRIAPYVLRIEMWDSSAEVGPTMQMGEYYSIRNLRTKISSGGYLEGKMQEGDKITKLDEDNLENFPRLAEMLKRKAQWEAEVNSTGGIHEFPHQLIEEAEEDRHFNCTVEVVHISPKDDFTYMYVTDYTARSDLVPVSASVAPATLADRVVRVELSGSQVDIARNLEIGDFVTLSKLRLRRSGGGTLLAGRLGGDQRLITKLNPKANSNARALQSRKEKWLQAQSKPKREGKRTATRAARQAAAAAAEKETGGEGTVAPTARKDKRFATLQDVKESATCPAVFRVRARPIDFFPDDLKDCVVLRCTSCDEILPKSRRVCTKCDDAMEDESHVEAFFELWFRVADADGETLDVSVADERCSILRELSPEDVLEDDETFNMLVARLRLLLGGLLNVKDGEARRRPVVQDEDGEEAPLLNLTIGSWLPDGVEDVLEARAYVVLDHSLAGDV